MNFSNMLKKKHISIIVAVAAIGAAAVSSVVIKRNSSTIFNQNVEALMEQEHASGKCAKDHKGPAYEIKH